MSSSDRWILDSGASLHVTSDSKLLQDLQLLEKPDRIVHAPRGEALPIVGRGSVKTERFKIPDVSYVPGLSLGWNIISVDKLLDNTDVVVEFSRTHCVIRDSKTRQEVGQGRLSNGYYMLDYLLIGQDVDSKVSQESSQAKATVRDSSKSQQRPGQAGTVDAKTTTMGTPSMLQMDRDEWVLDTRASMHHTSNPRLLLDGPNLQDMPPSGDDAPLNLARGFVQTKLFEVPDVSYVEGEAPNVISVAQLASSHGLVTVFEPTRCFMEEKKTGRMVGEGHLRDGVYVLDYLLIRQVPAQSTSTGGGRDEGRGQAGGGGGGDKAGSGASGGRDEGRGGGAGGEGEGDQDGGGDDGGKGGGGEGEEEKEKKDEGEKKEEEFCMDSGAANHMTWNENPDFLKPCPKKVELPTKFVSGIRGATLEVSGCGYINTDAIKLEGVLLVPSGVANLVSLAKLVNDYSARVVFDRQLFSIERLDTKEMIGQGHRKGNQYILDRFLPQQCHVNSLPTTKLIQQPEGGPYGPLARSSDVWALDSALLFHTTSDSKLLHDLQPQERPYQHVGTGDGRGGRARGEGGGDGDGGDDDGGNGEGTRGGEEQGGQEEKEEGGQSSQGGLLTHPPYESFCPCGRNALLILSGTCEKCGLGPPKACQRYTCTSDDTIAVAEGCVMFLPTEGGPSQTSKDFVMDSGAGSHMTCNGDPRFLSRYVYSKPPISSVTGIGGAICAVEGWGYITTTALTLKEVLHVPRGGANLVSLSKLVDDYHARVVFDRKFFSILSLQHNEMIGTGHRVGTHYYLDSFLPGRDIS